jgi:signal transduction histidine kinase
MDQSIPEADAEAIRQSIFAGRKIEAIKRVREATGLGLAEAKRMVEQVEGELRKTSPEKFTSKPAVGCSTTTAVLVVAIAIGWIWVTWN